MPDPPPFVLLPLADGRHELRVFSDDSEDPIILVLDEEDGSKLGAALADALNALTAPAGDDVLVHLTIAGREVRITGTPDRTLRLTVGR